MVQSAVACPWHHWRFSIENGSWLDNPKISIDTFRVRVMNGNIQVQTVVAADQSAEKH